MKKSKTKLNFFEFLKTKKQDVQRFTWMQKWVYKLMLKGILCCCLFISEIRKQDFDVKV